MKITVCQGGVSDYVTWFVTLITTMTLHATRVQYYDGHSTLGQYRCKSLVQALMFWIMIFKYCSCTGRTHRLLSLDRDRWTSSNQGIWESVMCRKLSAHKIPGNKARRQPPIASFTFKYAGAQEVLRWKYCRFSTAKVKFSPHSVQIKWHNLQWLGVYWLVEHISDVRVYNGAVPARLQTVDRCSHRSGFRKVVE